MGDSLASMFDDESWEASQSGERWKIPPNTMTKVAEAVPLEYKGNKNVVRYKVMLRKEIEERGKAGFERSLKFSEVAALRDNIEFLKVELAMCEIHHVFVRTTTQAEDMDSIRGAMPSSPAFVLGVAS